MSIQPTLKSTGKKKQRVDQYSLPARQHFGKFDEKTLRDYYRAYKPTSCMPATRLICALIEEIAELKGLDLTRKLPAEHLDVEEFQLKYPEAVQALDDLVDNEFGRLSDLTFRLEAVDGSYYPTAQEGKLKIIWKDRQWLPFKSEA